jgi:16S rRNA G966 N2-methylase RsmD
LAPPKLHPQRFLNGEVHDWYRIILGYSDHLVGSLLDEFRLNDQHRVLDPFCGSGTTLVEAMKRGVSSTGIDANPSSCFAARVKTNWDLDPDVLRAQLSRLKANYAIELAKENQESDSFYSYMSDTGFLKRWISVRPARKVIALKRAIKGLRIQAAYKDALMLVLMAETVSGGSNVKFGPELYCGVTKKDAAVFRGFEERVRKMCNDLSLIIGTRHGNATVIQGDARSCGRFLRKRGQFSAIISSPPYPTEHDYTRNSRLELALLGFVEDRATLREIKSQMIRSHTKGIYATDRDSKHVSNHKSIQALAQIINKKAADKTDGFARLYSTVLCEYFGGLKRHFKSVLPLIIPGGVCAYVVGDQSSYLQVHVPTAELLATVAVDCGFEHVETRRWRERWSTTMSRHVTENILILRVPLKCK